MVLGNSKKIDPRLRLGQFVGGFKLVDFLGKGGCGTVYLAENGSQRRALKILDRVSGDAMKEARRQERIVHPNIVRVYEHFDSPPSVLMELMSGGDLTKRGVYSFEKAIPVVLHILEGLKAIHERGLAHRDMKPHNVLFGNDDIPKVGDFGLAVYFRNLETHLKTSIDAGRGFSGTPDYMAPEQELLGQFDARSDIYSVGRMFYEMLVGHLPRRRDAVPSEFVTCPRELDDIVSCAMQDEINDRYSGADVMSLALKRLCPDFVALKPEPVVVVNKESIVPFVLDVETEHSGLLVADMGIGIIQRPVDVVKEIPRTVVSKKSGFWRNLLLIGAGVLGGLGLSHVDFSAQPTPFYCYVADSYRFGRSEEDSRKNLGFLLQDKDAQNPVALLNRVVELDARDGCIDNTIDADLSSSEAVVSPSDSPIFSHIERFYFDSMSDRDSFVERVGNSGIPAGRIIVSALRRVGEDGVFQSGELVELWSKLLEQNSNRVSRNVVSVERPSLPGWFEEYTPGGFINVVYDFSGDVWSLKSAMEGRRKFDSFVELLKASGREFDVARLLDSLDGVDDKILLSTLDDFAKKKFGSSIAVTIPPADSGVFDFSVDESSVAFSYSEQFLFSSEKVRDEFLTYFREKSRISWGLALELARQHVGPDGMFNKSELELLSKSFDARLKLGEGYISKSDYPGGIFSSAEFFAKAVLPRQRSRYHLQLSCDFSFEGDGLSVFLSRTKGEFSDAYALDVEDGRCDGLVSSAAVERLRKRPVLSSSSVSGNSKKYAVTEVFLDRSVRDEWSRVLKEYQLPVSAIIRFMSSDVRASDALYRTKESLNRIANDSVFKYGVNGTIVP